MSQHQSEEPILARHIELRSTRAGQSKPFIVGTRISVENIYVCHELQGMTPDEIVSSLPHLTLAQVHAALSYYFEHSEDIRCGLEASEAFADSMEKEQGATKFTELRDALLNRNGGENSVSS